VFYRLPFELCYLALEHFDFVSLADVFLSLSLHVCDFFQPLHFGQMG
jgi:hypothetical protein